MWWERACCYLPQRFSVQTRGKGRAFFFSKRFPSIFFFVSNGRSMICIGLVLWINCNSRGRQNIAASPASLLLKSTPQASSPLLTLLYPITTVNHLFELIDSYLDLIVVWFFFKFWFRCLYSAAVVFICAGFWRCISLFFVGLTWFRQLSSVD